MVLHNSHILVLYGEGTVNFFLLAVQRYSLIHSPASIVRVCKEFVYFYGGSVFLSCS